MDSSSISQTEKPVQQASFHPMIRVLATVVSFLFHPLFIPVYLSWFLIYLNPVFPGFSTLDKVRLLLRFFVMYTFFPLVTVLLAKGLGFVQSIYLRTQKDRIIPYVACGFYYFWMWYVLRNQPEMPKPLVLLSLAIFIASSLGLMANSYLKVSMHSIAVGVMSLFVLIAGFSSDASISLYISAAWLIAGLVCTARLITADHFPVEIYTGFFIGVISQLAAWWIV